MIKIEQIKINIGFTCETIKEKCSSILSIKKENITKLIILKQSIDARHKPNIFYVLNVALELSNNLENKFKELKYEIPDLFLKYEKKVLTTPPVIIGFGPSGMFAGLTLARMGLNPIIIEQGKNVDEREKDVQAFWKNKIINKFSNVQFGEGGAGTFSDGKLNSNLDNIYCKKVLNELKRFGAPEEITYQSKPHIGSDMLKKVVKNIRKEILSLGGKIYFSSKFEDFSVENNQITSIKIRNLNNDNVYNFQTSHLLLCVGHSARDVFKLLYNKKVDIKQKPFAMGVRIEQKQFDINESQYGRNYDKRLPPADYKLVVHLPTNRSVFTFCMCPGGQIISSGSNENEIVTNGMSNFARNSKFANSAILVNVTPNDFNSSHPLAGIEFQKKYENLAFKIAGENYNAPAQNVKSFLEDDENILNNVSTFKPGITLTNLKNCLPDFIYTSLKQALPLFNQKLKNFAKGENLLIAIESRSSCPITILRDQDFQCNIKGIYPVGEGAGYAGGIMSSAQDGIKVAEKIYEKIK